MKEIKTCSGYEKCYGEEAHSGPHIPKIQGEEVYGIISNTVISTFVFLILVTIFSLFANSVLKKTGSKLRSSLVSTMDFFYKYLSDTFGSREVARSYFPLIVGVFFVIFFGNIFGLIIDWAGTLTNGNSLILYYLRPMHSDLNTTLVLGLGTIVYSIFISFKHVGTWKTVKGYIFNLSGNSIGEKMVNFFVGWLHIIGLPSSALSLSLRLFGNIFAGMVLISVIGYLGYLMTESFLEIGRLLTVPFWFFELFVSFVQAAVFAGLMIAYFKGSLEESH